MAANRALSSVGLRLGSVLIGLLVGAVGATVYAADNPAPAGQCTSCHDQGQKLAKSAHAGPALRHLPRIPRAVSPPRRISPNRECATCHADQAGDYASGVHGLARKSGNEGAPDCALCHGSAHEMLSPKSPGFPTAVPDTCGMCHSDVVEQYRASVHGRALAAASPRLRCAPIATASTRSSNIPPRVAPSQRSFPPDTLPRGPPAPRGSRTRRGHLLLKYGPEEVKVVYRPPGLVVAADDHGRDEWVVAR